MVQVDTLDSFIIDNIEDLHDILPAEKFLEVVREISVSLEREVDAGRIRSYGFSSEFQTGKVSFDDIYNEVQRVKPDHHMVTAEYSLNILEGKAVTERTYGGATLDEFCWNNNVTRITRRPLHAKDSEGI